jgi:hypothetical protein
MKKILPFIVFIFFIIKLSGQDTIVVQTLTYDSTSRSYMFDFPEDTGQSYEKILMLYSMRCKNALVSTGSDRNKGCGEWDYSCNTFITDSTMTDSIKSTHPSHIIPGFNGEKFDYTLKPVYSYQQFKQFNTVNTNVISENSYQLGNGNDSLSHPFCFSLKTSKSQYLFTAEELKNAGLQTGNISALSLKILNTPQKANFLRIRIKQLDINELNESSPVLDDFEEVYFSNTQLTNGSNVFYFYKKFDWDGESNLLIELSYTNSEEADNVLVEGTELNENLSLIHNEEDYFLNFSGVGKLNLSNTGFSSVSNELTIGLWAYGNPDIMPANSTIFEGVDEHNKRQANSHLPWGNSRIYWDCGNEGSYDRIDKNATTGEIKGKWNYWTFTKNATTGSMKIYLNGELWHSGSGKKNKIKINKFGLGSSNNNNLSYFGYVDNLSIWNKELDVTAINNIMYKTPEQNNPNYNNLIGSYNLNEKEGNIFEDLSKQKAQAIHSGLISHKYFRGKDLFKEFETSKFRPNITFYQGEYEQSTETKIVLDSILNDIYKIYYYDTKGTDIVLKDSLNVFKAGYSYVYDNETGFVIDSVYFKSDSSIYITALDYYKKYPSKFELMSFVTPYGIGLDLGPEGKTWQFDVTDFKPVLTGKKRLSVEFGKYQEELDIKFLFIKGIPPRNVVKIQQIWRAGVERNYIQILDNGCFEPRNVVLNHTSSMFKIRTAITGHGQEGEFIGRNHFINLNGGEKEFNWLVWKECADNPVYPQGGTWIYDRAGWCPGAPTTLKEIEITNMVIPGDTVMMDYGIQTASGDSRYIVNCQLVSYGSPNFKYDIAIDEIQRPSKRIEFARFNPICFDPEIVIQNRGSEALTAAVITYYVEGGQKYSFNWSGNLSFLEKDTITLAIDNTSFWIGNGSNVFVAEIDYSENIEDEYPGNNSMSSKYVLPDVLQPDFIVVLRTNSHPEENKLYIRDIEGNTVYKKTLLGANYTYKKELSLEQGCYELEITDKGNDGLSFWANPSQGNGDLYFMKKNFVRIKNFNPDFGKFFRYSFLIGNINRIDNQIISGDIFDIYPNPATGNTRLKFNVFPIRNYSLFITDITGKKIFQIDENSFSGDEVKIDFSSYNSGIYFINLIKDGKSFVKKLVVE